MVSSSGSSSTPKSQSSNQESAKVAQEAGVVKPEHVVEGNTKVREVREDGASPNEKKCRSPLVRMKRVISEGSEVGSTQTPADSGSSYKTAGSSGGPSSSASSKVQTSSTSGSSKIQNSSTSSSDGSKVQTSSASSSYKSSSNVQSSPTSSGSKTPPPSKVQTSSGGKQPSPTGSGPGSTTGREHGSSTHAEAGKEAEGEGSEEGKGEEIEGMSKDEEFLDNKTVQEVMINVIGARYVCMV